MTLSPPRSPAGLPMSGLSSTRRARVRSRASRLQDYAPRCRLEVTRVGLFVDADDHSITAVLDMAPLDMLQFHGHESPQRVAEAKARFQCKVMKVVAIAGPDDLAAAADYEDVADMLLFDAKPPIRPDALPGGNGLAFDWGLIAGRSWRRPWMLSGGLTAELLPEAVRVSGAAIVDVSSGVETRPGHKDPAKISAFLAAAHAL